MEENNQNEVATVETVSKTNSVDAKEEKVTEKQKKETLDDYGEFQTGKEGDNEVQEEVEKEESQLSQEVNNQNVGKQVNELTLGMKNLKTAESKTNLKQPPPETEYLLKNIQWPNPLTGILSDINIITQNRNGPCPLISICNVLILQRKIELRQERTTVTYEELISQLGNHIVENCPSEDHASPTTMNKFHMTLEDVFNIFPKLQVGLDVNLKFQWISAFEPCTDLAVFELAGVPLVHGWTVDPQDQDTYKVVVENCKDYNRLVEKVIEVTSPTTVAGFDENKLSEGFIAEQFLESTASQLTYHGLQTLHDVLPEGSLSVLFRNNHFSIIYKHKQLLYTLVTDQGYAKTENIVWESMESIDGDSTFYDSSFKPYKHQPDHPPVTPESPTRFRSPTEDEDLLLAMSLQKEYMYRVGPLSSTTRSTHSISSPLYTNDTLRTSTPQSSNSKEESKSRRGRRRKGRDSSGKGDRCFIM